MNLLKRIALAIVVKTNIFKRNNYLLIDNTVHQDSELVDNFKLFEYMMSTTIKNRVFYIINKKHSRYYELKKRYKNHIIPISSNHLSFSLIFKLLTTKYWLDSYQMIFNYGLIQLFQQSRIIPVYMQHGINYFKLGYRYVYSPNVFKKVVVSNDEEFKLFNELYKYDDINIIKAGLSRWQNNNSSKRKKAILVYFTYRSYLNMLEDIESTQYVQKINLLLSSRDLKQILANSNTQIYIATHHEAKYKLNNISKNVKVISEQDIGKIKQEASLLITDFSSMCFDFMRNDVPVIFYHIDSKEPLLKLNKEDLKNNYTVESHNSELYNIYYNYNDVIAKIKYYINNNFKLEEEYKQINKTFFYPISNIHETIVENLEKVKLVKNINYPQLNLDELYIFPPNWPVPFAGEKIQCFNTFEAENDGRWSADKEVFCGFKLPQTKSIWKILLDYEPFVNK